MSLALLLGAGCVYYNTFFNARKKFNEAEELRAKSQESAQDNRGGTQQLGNRGVGEPGGQGALRNPGGVSRTLVTPQVRLLYEDAIKKASKVLKFHPESKYVDDALWLIGKSYFSMGDYLLADRKFQELVINHPDSRYADDSYYYSGLCQIELGNEDQAQKAFAKVESIFKKSEYTDDVYFARGKMDYMAEDYAAAIDQLGIYLEKFSKGDSAARAVYLTGQCKEEMGDYYGAYNAYSSVERYDPDNELYFESRLASAVAVLKTDSLRLGMQILQDLAKNEKYYAHSAEIRLRIAEGFYREGEIEKAVEEYNNVTVQSPRSEESAEAYYRLGLIYQNDLFDIVKAKEVFTSAQNESPGSEFRNLALSRSAQIAKLESYQIQLQRADSLKMAELETAPDSLGDKIPKIVLPEPEVVIADSLIPPPPAIDSIGSGEVIEDTVMLADTLQTRNRIIPGTLDGSLSDFIGPLPEGFYARLDSATIGSPPGDTSGAVNMPAPVNEDSLEAAEAARKDSVRQEIIRSGIETRFLLAELYAYELNRPDSALNEYLLIVREHPESPYAAKSLLAAANIEFSRSDSIEGNRYLRRIIDEYPRSPQAVRAAEVLSYALDFSKNAIGLYARAESLIYYYDSPDSAIAVFRYIAESFPDLAPQAKFAIAWTLDNIINVTDSSAYYAYTAVNAEYPETEYAQAAKVRLGMVSRPHVTRRQDAGGDNKTPDEPGEQVVDPDSLRRMAMGLRPAPPVLKAGEFLYPEELLDRDLRGEVIFKIKIDVTGRVQDYEIIGPSGHRAIDSVATAALLETEFDTAELDFAQLESFFRYNIPFERPEIDIFNDPYREQKETEGH
jgi:TonB family protein